MKQTIYTTDNYEAFVVHKPSDTIVVSFAERKEPKPANFSGQPMLEKTGYSYCCVRSFENDWYIQKEFSKCLQRISEETSKYKRVILYGFSMGSYGALRSARELRASRVIVMAPIANIHPNWDKRWIPDYGHLIDGRNEASLDPEIRDGTEIFVVYDKKGPDVRHAKKLSAEQHTHVLNVDRAGHMIFQMLNGSGILGSVARSLMQPNVNLSSIQTLINKSKKNNAYYISELSRALDRHKKLRFILLKYAVIKFPNDDTLKLDLAGATAEAGNVIAAANMIRSIVRRTRSPMGVPVTRALVRYAEAGGSDSDVADLVAVYETPRGRSREVQLLYSRYLRHVKRYDDAFRAHDFFMKGGPFSSQGYFERGLIFEELRLPYMAKECYRNAIAEDASFSRAKIRLNQLEK